LIQATDLFFIGVYFAVWSYDQARLNQFAPLECLDE